MWTTFGVSLNLNRDLQSTFNQKFYDVFNVKRYVIWYCIINCYWWHFVWWRQFSSYVTLFHNFRLACEVVPANMRSFARNDLQLKPSIWFIHFHGIHGIFSGFLFVSHSFPSHCLKISNTESFLLRFAIATN